MVNSFIFVSIQLVFPKDVVLWGDYSWTQQL